MDKKQLLWIIVLSFAGVMLWQQLTGDKEKPAPTAPAGAPTAAPISPAAAGKNPWSYGGTRFAAGAVPASHRLGSLDPDREYRFQLEIDPRGAAVRTAKLTGYYQTVEQKRTKDKTPQQLEDWSYAILAPVTGAVPDLVTLPFSTQSILVDGRAISTFVSPVRNGNRYAWEMIERILDDNGMPQLIRFRLRLRDDPNGPPVFTLIKTYTVVPKSYSFRMTLRIENHSTDAHELAVVQYGPTGVPLESVRGDVRDAVVASYITADNQIAVPKGGKVERTKALDSAAAKDMGDNRAGTTDPAMWAGVGNKFFGCLMYPIPTGITPSTVDEATPTADLVVPASQYGFAFSTQAVGTTKDLKSQLVLMTTDPVTVAAGDALELNVDIFCGPKSNGLFNRTDLYDKLQFTNAITFRSCNWCLIEPLARFVMWVIEAGGAAIGNYGVIIIIMVLLIRLALHPITKRSQTSMMKMKKLQPQMQEVQEKYKNDKEGQQKAMMSVMKESGFSPVLGCLPMLLQMPIWIALWAGLGASVVLRHEGLLPFWITDLAGPDTVIAFSKPVNVPLLGAMIGPIRGLNILPLLLTVFMFLQQKLTPMQSAGPANPDQQKQQKMMMYMMSLMMLLIFYNAPSGLTLYIMTSTGGGVLESYIIRKHIREREEMEAASEVRVTAPGKVARGQRPKKPKDRFRM